MLQDITNNVAADGNCLYNVVLYQLNCNGVNVYALSSNIYNMSKW